MAHRPGIYHAVTWRGPVANGNVSDVQTVELIGYAKQNDERYPYLVANEFVASRIGTQLGLPLPPGAPLNPPERGQSPAWVTLSFTPGVGQQLPPVDPAAVVAADPVVAAGVVVFDIFIGNTDRHAWNLAYMPSQRRLEVFDHGHALLGTGNPVPETRFRTIRDTLAIEGTLGNRHCLLDYLESAKHVSHWCETIHHRFDNSGIERLCREAVDLRLGGSAEQLDRLAVFLIQRRTRLNELVRNHAHEFTSIPANDWGMT